MLAGEIFLGYLEQHYAQDVPIPVKSVSGLDYGVTLDWYADPIVTVHLTASKQISDVTLGDVSAADNNLVKLSADYEFRRNITFKPLVPISPRTT